MGKKKPAKAKFDPDQADISVNHLIDDVLDEMRDLMRGGFDQICEKLATEKPGKAWFNAARGWGAFDEITVQLPLGPDGEHPEWTFHLSGLVADLKTATIDGCDKHRADLEKLQAEFERGARAIAEILKREERRAKGLDE